MKKFTLLGILLTLFSFSSYAQFGCGSAVVLTNGFTQSAITTPGNGGLQDWNTNPTGTSISASYWDDDVYLFQYTAGAIDESISMTTFSRSSWNGIGIFSTCTGTTFSGELAAVGTTGANTTKTVTAIVAAGTTVYIATGQWGTPNNLDFDVVSFSATPITMPPNCSSELTTPTNGTMMASTSGNLSWTAATGNPSGYKISMGTTAGGTDILNAFPVGNVLTYNVGTLLPATTYFVKIIPTNSNGDATGCTEYSFTTCGPNTTFFENFDSSVTGSTAPMPNCWDRAGTGSTYITTGSVAPNSPANRLYMFASSTATPATVAYALTPTLSNLQAESHRLKFKAYCTTAGKTLDIGYFTDMSDLATFTTVETVALPATAQTSTQEFTIEPTGIPAGVTKLVFRNNPTTASATIYIDDVLWEVLPACADITLIQTQGFDSTTATIAWEPGGSETAWEYVYGPAATTTSPEGLTPVAVTNNPVGALTGLTPNTTYRVWIRSNCGNGALGNWPQNPFTFTTSCAAVATFSENFDSYTSTGSTNPLPNCWTRLGNTGSSYITTGSVAPMSPSNRLFLSGAATGATNGVAVMPPVSNLQAETHRLKFTAYATTADKVLEIGYYEPDTEFLNFVVLETFPMPSTAAATALEFIYTPEFVVDGVESIAFRVNGGAFTGTTTIYIDDVIWEPIPSCPDIVEFDIADIGTTTADIGWTPGGSETAWQYVYGPTSVTDPATLTPVDVVNNPFISISDLTPNTNYKLWVRANCGSGSFGNWSDAQTFTTLCAPVTDFFENFDSYTLTGSTNPLPNCWIKAGNGSTYITTGGVAPMTPPNRLYMSASGTATTPTTSIAMMPEVSNLSAGTHRLKFRAYASAVDKTVAIGYFTDPADITTYVELETINITSSTAATAANFTYIPSGIPAGVTRLAFVNAGLPASTTLYIDNVTWETIPLCPDVNAPVFGSATSTTANITWTPGGSETVWQYVYGLATETDPLTLTPIVDVSGTPQATITGLLPATNYKVWIRSVCGTDLGAFSQATTFTTACEAAATFSENFDTSATGSTSAMPTCWMRAGNGSTYVTTGGVAPGSAPNRLYMFASGTATIPTVGYAIMPPVSNLQADTHRLKFKAYATTTGKYLEIGYFTNIADLTSFVLVETVDLPGTTAATAQTFTINPANIPAGVSSLAFRNPGTPTASTTAYIDDVIWEAKPTVVPTCSTNIVATPNANCGNFATVITWDTNADADGYNLTIGTTTGASDVLNNQDIGAVTTYSFIGTFNTQYFYTLTPYNSAGSAVNCVEQTFTTAVDGCYCTSVPTSNDGLGITNVLLGTQNFTNGDVTYFDHTATTVDLAQGITSNLQVTLATGYTYGTNVWIDFNDNLTFELSELVFQGESTNVNPTVFDASFVMPVTATLGTHRMRIVSTDIIQVPANPCYGGTYGVTLDFNVNIVPAPTCLAPSGLSVDSASVTATTATANWTASTTPAAGGYEYYYDTTNTAPTDSTTPSGSVAAGITTVSLTDLTPATTYRVYVRSICSTTDSSDWSVATVFTTLCANFDAPFAQNFDNYVPLCWTTADAGTAATGPTGSAAGIWTADGFLNNGETGAVKVNLYLTNRIGWLITPPLNTTVGSDYSFSFNYGVTAWNLTTPLAMGSDDFVKVMMTADNGVTWTEVHTFNAASNVLNTSQEYSYDFVATSGEVKFAFFASDGTVDDTQDYDFFVDSVAFDTNLSNVEVENNAFTAYPNPVKDNLIIRYNENITDVTVYNLLGQQMFVKNINATEGQVDMSNLATGTYLVRVNSADKTQTIKVIKE